PTLASPGSPSSTIIGYILSDPKKFRCLETSCSSMAFGRLADLRRHHNQQHAKDRKEFFCPVMECARNGKKGGKKGFGARRDKRDEHVRNVHQAKGCGGRKRARTEN
ncbi:hypothetical protein K504DRAFT_332873, partial [Pleomassaria siparia CBS 279.74]